MNDNVRDTVYFFSVRLRVVILWYLGQIDWLVHHGRFGPDDCDQTRCGDMNMTRCGTRLTFPL